MSETNPASHAHHHRKSAPTEVPTAVVTVSDARTVDTDTGGARVAELLVAGGHPLAVREIVKDEPVT
jgi:molybdenum cofactor biosynthesis protein B